METALVISLGAASLSAAAAVFAVTKERAARRRARAAQRELAHLGAEIVRLRRAALGAAVHQALARAGRTPADLDLRAEAGEDAFLLDLFLPEIAAGRGPGFFIEAGAHDGYGISVTYALEQLGWSGLLVEAIPERFEQCRARRPGSRCVHAALGPDGAAGSTSFTVAEGEGLDVLSFRNATEGHKREIASRGGRTRTISVPLTSLNALLRDHAGPIDVLSLDVEGAEAEVLRGLDLGRFGPRVMLIEDATAGRSARVAELVTAAGYEQAGWLGFNRVFVTTREPALSERARRGLSPLPRHSAQGA